MVTLKYRLIGNVVANPALTKEFDTRDEAMQWAKAQGNVYIISLESTGAQAFNRIFGGK